MEPFLVMVLDSLDRLFYEACDKREREEMERIREVSMPYYQDVAVLYEGRERAELLCQMCYG